MPKQNFKSHAKRKRELAKLDKRIAKDQKRALRRADGSETVVVGLDAAATSSATAGARSATAVPPKPVTFAEAVERWKATKVVKPKRRG